HSRGTQHAHNHARLAIVAARRGGDRSCLCSRLIEQDAIAWQGCSSGVGCGQRSWSSGTGSSPWARRKKIASENIDETALNMRGLLAGAALSALLPCISQIAHAQDAAGGQAAGA